MKSIKEKIKVGTKVTYRPACGAKPPKTSIVKKIEKCANKGDKYGNQVNEISWENKDYGVYTLIDGHWCYGHQIDKIVKRHKIVLEHTRQRSPLEQGCNLVKLEMLLSDEELDFLKECINQEKESGTMALYRFTHNKLCSKHHKYRIWNTFEEGEINITIIS